MVSTLVMTKAVFLDKDGTLIEDVPYNVKPELVRFTEGAVQGLLRLKAMGYLLIVVSNQSGVARGYFDEEALHRLYNGLNEKLQHAGLTLDGFFFCPHHPTGVIPAYAGNCQCRKPAPGMILQAADQLRIDVSASWMIGDILNDVEAGNRAGCKTILIDNGNETEWIQSDQRKPTAVAANFTEAVGIITDEFKPV